MRDSRVWRTNSAFYSFNLAIRLSQIYFRYKIPVSELQELLKKSIAHLQLIYSRRCYAAILVSLQPCVLFVNEQIFSWNDLFNYDEVYRSTTDCCCCYTENSKFRLLAVIVLNLQDAQLSQRDRAAGCVSFVQKWKTGTGRQFYGHYRSIFNHCDINGLQSYRIRWKTQNKGFYAVQGHSRLSR